MKDKKYLFLITIIIAIVAIAGIIVLISQNSNSAQTGMLLSESADNEASNSSRPESIILHRTTRYCGNHSVSKEESSINLSGGYSNYRCRSRYYEQCIQDNSFDTYYDEWCEYYENRDLSKATILHRTTRDCEDNSIAREESSINLSGGYSNYRCRSRYYEQCIQDNSFDTYYDEWCEYETEEEQEYDCTDSDGGENIYLKGTTIGWDSYGGDINEIGNYTDRCNGNRVMEFYCEYINDSHNGQGYVTMTNSICPNGCENGVCILISNITNSYCKGSTCYLYEGEKVYPYIEPMSRTITVKFISQSGVILDIDGVNTNLLSESETQTINDIKISILSINNIFYSSKNSTFLSVNFKIEKYEEPECFIDTDCPTNYKCVDEGKCIFGSSSQQEILDLFENAEILWGHDGKTGSEECKEQLNATCVSSIISFRQFQDGDQVWFEGPHTCDTTYNMESDLTKDGQRLNSIVCVKTTIGEDKKETPSGRGSGGIRRFFQALRRFFFRNEN